MSAVKPVQPQQRRVEFCEVNKDDLLRIFKAEALAPESATNIIGTGHRPDSLTFTVAFD